MSRKKSKSSKQKKALNTIDPNVYKNGHKTDPIRKVLDLLEELDKRNKYDLIYKLAANPLLPKQLIQVYNGKNYYNTFGNGRALSKQNGIYWTLGILKNCSKIVKRFIQLREQFNISLLASDAQSAHSVLDELDSFCLSWWSIENRIHLRKEIKKEDTKDSIKSLEAIFKRFDVKNKLDDLLILSESNSVDFYTHSLQERLSEYRNSKSSEAISYAYCTSLLALPISYDHERVAELDHMYHFRNESIIDQYILLSNSIQEIYSNGRPLKARVLTLAHDLAQQVADEELLCILEGKGTPCSFVNQIVDEYTKGHYLFVVDSIRATLSAGSSEVFGLLEIYARACKYTNQSFGHNLFDQIASALADIVSADAASRDRIEYLNKIRVKFRNESWCKSLSFHLLHILQEVNDAKKVELSRLATIGMHKINTPKASSENFTLHLKDNLNLKHIPPDRAIRYDLDSHKPFSIDATAFPIFSDYLKQQAKEFIKHENWNELIDFFINQYLENKVSFFFFPANKICEKIADRDIIHSKSAIPSIVALHIYSQEANSAFDDLKTEIFEEWLESHNTHMPSIIFESKALDTIETYFLEKICTPSQLDNIAEYEGDIDVISERVSILNILIAFTKDPNGELSREKLRIIEDLFADKLRAKIEAGKLFVDVQGFATNRKEFYKSLFEHVKSIKGGVALEEYDDIEMMVDSKDVFDLDRKTEGGVPLIAPSSEKTDGLAKLFMHLTKDFALNENYGLDKYLSAEIRHVVFEEQIRSCFERTNLITLKENGEYLSNEFWRARYNFVQDSMLDRLDEAFRSFSIATDKTLKQVNNQFRVGTDFKKSGDYIFDFSSYYAFVVELSKVVEEANSFDEFFKGIIEYMWRLTDLFAKQAQALINDELKAKILFELDTLEHRISHIKNVVPMTELMQEIRNARSYFNNSIEIVLSWFRFVDSGDSGKFEPLGVVVEAAIGSANSFFRHKKIDLTFTQNRTNLKLNFRESRALFVALFTALENSFRYNYGNGPIRVEHTRTECWDTIKIVNNADRNKFADPHAFIETQKAKWIDPDSKLSRKEGGTGLYKINNLLENSSSGFSLDIEFLDNHFSVLIRLAHENFTSGR